MIRHDERLWCYHNTWRQAMACANYLSRPGHRRRVVKVKNPIKPRKKRLWAVRLAE